MSRRSLLVVGLTAWLGGSGCTSFDMAHLRNRIDRDVPEAQIGDGFALAFGGLTMGTARTVVALSDDGDDPSITAVRALMRNVRKVQIGRYDVDGAIQPAQIARLPVFDAYERDGWLPVVTVRDEQAVWVLARERGDTLRDLLVVVLSEEELVLARMSGNLSEAVAAALAETTWTRDLARSLTAPPDSLAADSLTTESG